MISFFSKYPVTEESKKGGLSQRILAIDSLFLDKKRIYIESSFTKNFNFQKIEVDDMLTVYRLNFFIHFFKVFTLLTATRFIYVHTIANIIKTIPVALFKNNYRIVCDMHGVLPEECEMNGWRAKRIYYKLIEKVAFNHFIDYSICVSSSMKKHYNEKYPTSNALYIILPIFTILRTVVDFDKEIKVDNKTVIYAGGTQIWQNTALMLSVAERNVELNFEFWLPKAGFEMYKERNQHSHINFKTGSNIDVVDAYSHVHMGFALRDENVVNDVSCPTKIIEYIQNDIIPILKYENVGDFKLLGLEYLTLEGFLSVSKQEIMDKIENNRLVLNRFNEIISTGKAEIISILGKNK